MEFLHITLTGWVALSIAISMAFLATLMFILGKERFHYIWAIFCVAVAIWAGGFYMVTLSHTPEAARLWWKISYIGMILNPFLYFQFTLEFTRSKFFSRHRLPVMLFVNGVAAVFLYLDLATNLIIDKVNVLFGELYYNTPPGALYLYFMSLFLALIVWSLGLIFHAYYKKDDDQLFRQRAIYFFIASAIAYVGGSMNFLPIYGIQVNPVTNFAVAFGAIFIAYAILRRGLFDVKVVTAQMLTLMLATFAFTRIFVSGSVEEITFNVLMFILTLIIGIYLIRSVRKEIALREHIERLVSELEATNERQENLIHFISHEVKGYLTKAMGGFAALAEGDFGQLPPDAKALAQEALIQTRAGAHSVMDILQAANLKRGTVSYHMTPFDFGDLTKQSFKRFAQVAADKGLTYTLSIDEKAGPYTVAGDKNQLAEHVVRNIMENAVNYTLHGSVLVTLSRQNDHVVLAVTDTGIGITDEDKQRLFTEGGHGKDSIKVNAHSTGYGLYIAKQIVDAHHGTIRAESTGPAQGSTFTLELPAA